MVTFLLRQALFLLVTLLLFSSPLQAEERITSFDSRVTIEQSGVVTVIETIAVVAEGKEIKRGIYRDFPTEYTDRSGHLVRVGFTPLRVERDGRPEPFFLKEMGNGVRIYMGEENVFLVPGPYTYTLTYQTSRQIGFFAGYDELYWNVTGNDWSFPIERVTATVVLPEETPILQHALYTGRQGSRATDGEVAGQAGNTISFRTTVPLQPREGLTVAVAWPKGVVVEPDTATRTLFLIRDNLAVFVAISGLLVLLVYYLIVWNRVGRDPEPGTIIPLFEPPPGLSPAAARFVIEMGFDHKGFAAALVNMAVKKYLVIAEKKGVFTLHRSSSGQEADLSRGEKKSAEKLFASHDQLELKQANHAVIQGAISALDKSLREDFEALHFRRNRIYLVPGVGITLIILLVLIVSAREREVAGFMGVWLSIWTVGCYTMGTRIAHAWKSAAVYGSGILVKGSALVTTFFALPFFAGWIFGIVLLGSVTSYTSVTALLSVIVVNLIFYYLLKAPTIHGRAVMDRLDGLKLYLAVAEKDRLNLLNPPEKTPELFEKFLPWALALDVEQQWSEQFSELLARAGTDGSYSPSWYIGGTSFTAGAMASSLGSSLAATISSSASAPGSSSGSGGGGSSGGGGGGGGGGGW